MSQESEAAWTLSGHAANRLFLNETASRAGMVAGMDGEAVYAQPKVGVGLDNDHFKAADTQASGCYLGHVNSFAGVPRSVLQDALGANSVSKRVKSEKLNNGDLIISAKR
ncbi:hypothetical protein ZEAMMB73_Zm00001d028327, partial [Zea mays]